MSSAFAIAAVTAVLKDLLNDGINDQDFSDLGNVTVTALPPDRIASTNTEEHSQLNLFMYHVTPNSGWRNVGLPSRDAQGARLTNPPLALDLHYLVTAYGAQEFHAEVLLGYAMQLLHETPILTRKMINDTLKPPLPSDVSLPPGIKMLSTSDLAEQVETIKICPEILSTEEMSRLWTATQGRYRPTAAYQISVVLIQETKPVRAALPVLTRGPEDGGPIARADLIAPYPTLEQINLPNNQTAARLNDEITLVGHHLAGDRGEPTEVTLRALLVHQLLPEPIQIEIPDTKRTDRSATFTIPHQAGIPYPAGFYRISVQVEPNGKPEERRESNELALLVAPRILAINGTDLPAPPGDPISIARTDPQANGLGDVTLQIKCSPDVEVLVEDLAPERVDLMQSAVLLLGDRALTAEELPVQTAGHPDRIDTLTFKANQIAAGTYRLRLRIDGVDSFLIDRSDASKPKFDESQRVTLT
jgi:hypothetical protein